METKYKEIPFDVNRINEKGVQIVTRTGRNARVICTNHRGSGDESLIALIDAGGYENVVQLYKNGRFYCDKEDCDDLFMKVPCKLRRMTNQELAWWLRDCPEEHREYKYFEEGEKSPEIRYSYQVYEYIENEANEQVGNILIRSNRGEWEEPLIEN